MKTHRDYEQFFNFLYKTPQYVMYELDHILCLYNGGIQNQGLIYYTPEILEVLKTDVYKRSNKIFQLGTQVFTNEDLMHDRGKHGKGAYARMVDILMNLSSKENIHKLIQKKHYEKYLLAEMMRALLHDIGHGPFSHTMETICNLPKGFHEKIGKRLIHENKELRQALNKVYPNMAEIMDEAEKRNFLGLNSVIEEQFDVDRGDFLVRDLFFAVGYGDKEMGKIVTELIDNIDLKKVSIDGKTKLVLAFPSNQLENIERFLDVRFNNYKKIYNSSEGRLYEYIFKEFANRLLEVDEQYPLKTFFQNNIGKNAEEIDLDEYIKYNDLEFLKESLNIFKNTKDPRLKELSRFCIPDANMHTPILSLMISPEESDEYGNVNHPKEDIEFLKEIEKIDDDKEKLLKENYHVIEYNSEEEMNSSIDKIKQSKKLGIGSQDLDKLGIICDVTKNSTYKNKPGEEIFLYDENGEIFTYDKAPARTMPIKHFENAILIIDKKQLAKTLGKEQYVHEIIRLLDNQIEKQI